ncbi:D-alanyl-D-alanine carboxypeptidase, partial [Vibrio xuii]
MKKTTLINSVLASSIALSATFASPTFATPIVVPDAPMIAAKGYVLMDYHSGKVLAEKEMHTQLSPASLTKMMTSYVVG